MYSKDAVEFLQKNINIVESLEKQRSEYFTNWVGRIITILMGLLSVLVIFNKSKVENEIIIILYSSILISITIGIIFGVIFLFNKVSNLKQTLSIQRGFLTKRLNGDFDSVLMEDIKPKKIYEICGYIFYIFSLLSIIFLVIYGILINTQANSA